MNTVEASGAVKAGFEACVSTKIRSGIVGCVRSMIIIIKTSRYLFLAMAHEIANKH